MVNKYDPCNDFAWKIDKNYQNHQNHQNHQNYPIPLSYMYMSDICLTKSYDIKYHFYQPYNYKGNKTS